MKKIASLLLCCSLLIGTPSMGLAGVGAESLKQFAFIQGNEKGELMVEKPLTRAEACVLLSEIYGVKDKAKVHTSGFTFKDVQKKQWFSGYISYAKSQGWVDGYTDGTFKPTDTIAAKEWASMLMRALSYKMEWATVEEDLMTLGVVVNAQNPQAILRGEAFEAMWQAVNTPRNGKEVSLGVELGRLAAPPPKPQSAKLSSRPVTSLKEVVLEANAPLDAKSVERLKNYEVATKGLHDLAVEKVQYNKAQGKIYLILNRSVAQLSEVQLKVSGLKGENGLDLDPQTFMLNMLDMTQPTILGAEVIGKRFIKLEFSEPLMSRDEQEGNFTSTMAPKLPAHAFLLNEGGIAIKDITLQKGHKVAIIETYVELMSSVKIRPRESAKDYFNFKLLDSNLEIAYYIDTAPPMVVGYENVSPTEVTLIFNEEIRLLNPSTAGFYHTSPSNTVEDMSTERHLDGKRLTLNFSRSPMASGDRMVYIAPNVVTDYSGNPSPAIQYTIKIEKDLVLPEVVKLLPVTETILRVQYSEAIYNPLGEAQSRSNFKLTDANGKDVSDLIRTLVYKSDTHATDLVFASPLRGSYKLLVTGLKDYSGNVMVEKNHTFEMKDLMPPNPAKWSAKLYQGGTQNQMIKIKFDEAMAVTGGNSILLAEKYVINGMALDKLDQSLLKMEAADQGTSVLIYYPGKMIKNGVDFNVLQDAKIEIGRLADVDGNYIQAFSTSIKLETQGYLKIVEVSQVDKNKVEVLLGDRVDFVDQTDFVLYGPNRIYQILESKVNYVNNQTSVILTLNENFDENVSATKFRVVGMKTKNIYGETFNPWGLEFNLKDKMKPYVLRTTIEGVLGDSVIYSKTSGVAEIRFSENIDPRTVSILSFGIGNYKINDIQVSGNVVRIYVDASDKDKVSLYDVILQKVEIRDLSGNGVQNLVLSFTKIYP